MHKSWIAGNDVYQYFSPTRVKFGVGASKQAGDEMAGFGCMKPLLVSDRNIENLGLLDGIRESLSAAAMEYAEYLDIMHEPDIEQINAGLEVYKNEDCDGIIAVGGGSCIDTAKAIGILVTNEGTIRDYYGFMMVKKPLPPLVCCPTTHGTGSEVGPATIVTDKERKFKQPIGSPLLFPKLAILDPTLVNKLPQRIAASTSLDAMAHAVDGYLSPAIHLYSEAFALSAIELIGKNIRRACTTQELEPTMRMQVAASMGLTVAAHTKGALIHALGHALGAIFDTPHGIAIGLFMPYTLDFNLISCPDKLRAIARAWDLDSPELTDEEAGAEAIEELKRIMIDLDLPMTLKELGFPEERIPELVDATMMSKMFLDNNPRVCGKDEITMIIKKAFG